MAARKDGGGTPRIRKLRVGARADDLLDRVNDELAYRMTMGASGIINLKLTPELPDRQVITVQH